jgi:hypothetical protein
MRTFNFLDGVSGSGLYFITSGQVQRAIGKQDPFSKISDPAERIKKIDKLSKAIEKEVNASIKRKIQPPAKRKE